MPGRMEIRHQRIGRWDVPVVFRPAYRWPLSVYVGNRDGVHTQGHRDEAQWKQKIADAVRAERDALDAPAPGAPQSPWGNWSLSIALNLQPEAQGRDIDNLAKPIIDAVAEGLGFPDDSSFKTLFVHVISERAGSLNDEPGVAIYVAQDFTA